MRLSSLWKSKIQRKIDMTFQRIGFYADLGEKIDVPDHIDSEEQEGVILALYRLPIGIQPSKIEKAVEALQISLEAEIEWRVDGRFLEIEAYKKKIPDMVKFGQTFLTKGNYAPVLNVGIGRRGMEVIDYSKTPNPYMLIGSAPGMGKSNAIHVMLPQLLYQGCTLWLGDPKYDYDEYQNHVKQYETDHAAIKDMVSELSDMIDNRQKQLSEKGYKKILDHNAKEKEKMDYIFLVIDEIADFDPKDDEDFWDDVTKIVRKGRSSGIWSIFSTQRASLDMFSGTVKSNILLRLCFKTSTAKNSEIILESPRGFYLPAHPGRGVLLNGLEREIQVPVVENVRSILDEIEKGRNSRPVQHCSCIKPGSDH